MLEHVYCFYVFKSYVHLFDKMLTSRTFCFNRFSHTVDMNNSLIIKLKKRENVSGKFAP